MSDQINESVNYWAVTEEMRKCWSGKLYSYLINECMDTLFSKRINKWRAKLRELTAASFHIKEETIFSTLSHASRILLDT